MKNKDFITKTLEEFDKKFPYLLYGSKGKGTPLEVKSFLKQALEEMYEKGYKKGTQDEHEIAREEIIRLTYERH